MPNFEEIYGKPADEMTEGEFKMATLGILNSIVEQQTRFEKAIVKRLDITNGKVKCVDTHKTYFKVIAFAGGAMFIALLGILADLIVRGII